LPIQWSHRAGLDSYETIKWDAHGGHNGKGNLDFVPDVKELFTTDATTERKTDSRLNGLKMDIMIKKHQGLIPMHARPNREDVDALLGRDGSSSSAADAAGGTLGNGSPAKKKVKSEVGGGEDGGGEEGGTVDVMAVEEEANVPAPFVSDWVESED
jgi:hypothetical protein